MGITGCFRTSKDKLYSELGLESLADRRFYRSLVPFYNIVNKKPPQYLINYLPTQDLASINLGKRPEIYPLDDRTERYYNSYFSLLYLTMKQFGEWYKKSPIYCYFQRDVLICNNYLIHLFFYLIIIIYIHIYIYIYIYNIYIYVCVYCNIAYIIFFIHITYIYIAKCELQFKFTQVSI